MSQDFKHAKGHVAKLKLMQKYVSLGWYVYDECNQGPIDFIAVNPSGDVKFIECKSISRRSDGSKIYRVLDDSQKKLNKKLKSKGLQIAVEHVDVDKEMENRI